MSKLQSTHWQKQGKNARKITKRIVIEGDLVLETPTRFGNGDRDGLTDLTISRDALDGRPLLPGASIAGALRSYLRTREVGFRQAERAGAKAKLLFGEETEVEQPDGTRTKSSSQSYFIAYDSLATPIGTELRDGVTIDPKTRTAVDKKKYDLELLAAGTTFPLRLELFVVEGKEKELRTALALALQGFERGEIPLGARRRRGFGQCRIQHWQVCEYDLTNAATLIAWLNEDAVASKPAVKSGDAIAALLNASDVTTDQRVRFELEALFGIAGSLLIRSSTEDPHAPDMVHLRSLRNGQPQPIISGTSLAGALRGRALRIAKTLNDGPQAEALIDELFGHLDRDSKNKEQPSAEANQADAGKASRLWVEESVIENPHELVVSRVKIDRFTGGSFPTALFNEQPVFGLDETAVRLRLRVDDPTPADKGLLLLLLKDLWTEDLPIGGEASVGRGRLRGKCASLITRHGATEPDTTEEQAQTHWQIRQAAGRLDIQGDRAQMEACVQAFCQKVGGTA